MKSATIQKLHAADQITGALETMETGDSKVAMKLLPQVDAELRKLAAQKMAHE